MQLLKILIKKNQISLILKFLLMIYLNGFKKKTGNLKIYDKTIFLDNFHNEPDIHIVFKDEKKMKQFEQALIPSSFTSGFLQNREKN